MGDKVQEARALNNRGLLHVYTGRFARAEADLAQAERLVAEVGNLTEAAGYCHNRGFAAARKGDLPTALGLFEKADQRSRAFGAVHSGARLLDRAAALLAAGLVSDADRSVTAALATLRDGGNQSDLAEGLALLADIALLAGQADRSRAAAHEAGRLFDSQKRPGWAALARAAVARAALSQGDVTSEIAEIASVAASELDSMGFSDRATLAHAVAGRLWARRGDTDMGVAELARAGARRNYGTAAGRLAAWEAEAHRRMIVGDRRGAMAALRSALGVVEAQQASLGATELRAHIAVHVDDAAALGLALALEGGRPGSILRSMESHRANSLRSWPALPPKDPVLSEQLSELRGLANEISACADNGTDPAPLLAHQAALEGRVRERSWHTPVMTAKARRASTTRLRDLPAALGGATLIELAHHDGKVHAVVVGPSGLRHRRLADLAATSRELTHLRMAMRRLAFSSATEQMGAGADQQLDRSARRLDDLLIAPLAPLIGTGPLVIVPTGELHATPWSVLPSLEGRPLLVAPSAQIWLDVTARQATGPTPSPSPDDRQSVVIVAGPGLVGADEEAKALADMYPDARLLSGDEAGVAEVISAIEGAGVAHIAAHSSFRADNGLWSSIQLSDGPLTVYELERLRRPPRTVVLSACQSGMSTVRPGDEIMGLVAALLSLGTTTVVASVLPLDDRASTATMVEFHRRLQTGGNPSTALAAAQAHTGIRGGGAYVCFGAD
jgi:tetratricopeptide (TPR) repeat protein